MISMICYNLNIKEQRRKHFRFSAVFNVVQSLRNKKTSVRVHTCAAALIMLLLFTLAVPCPPVFADDDDPTVTLVPPSGELGVKLYVQLENFGVKKGVIITFGGNTNVVDSVITNEDGAAIGSFIVDERAGGAYEVWADDGENKGWALFNVKPKMELSVTSAYVGDQVLATGYGFNAEKTATIYFDDVEIGTCEIDERGSFIKVPFAVPNGANGKHTVRVEDSKQESYEETFNIKPKITSSPGSGSVGSKVTVSGTGFTANGNVVIYFNEIDVTGSPVSENGTFSTSFIVPDCSTGTHKIKVDDSLNRYYADFSTEASLTLKPKEGNIGTQLTLEGSGFKAETPVTITFDNIDINIVTSTESGGFFLKFNTPKSNHGAHTVTASDGTTSLEAKYTVESTPPIAPTLLAPPDETRFSKGIELDWSDVIDPSGVTYSLEISADGEFSEIILSETNLTESEFSLPEDQETIPHRQMPYFWRVRAVDGASNISEWSEQGSFILGHNFASIIGNMPGWTKYILIGMGLLVFAILFLWLGSRRKTTTSLGDTSEQEDEYDEQYDDDSDYDDSILLPS
jgi:hypothetical protein